MRSLPLLLAVACTSNAPGASGAPTPPQPPLAQPALPWVDVALGAPIKGFDYPVGLVGSGDGRIYVVEQGGLVKIVKDGAVEAAPLLDVKKLLGRVGGEQGLLGLAVHPKDKNRLFIAYTDDDEDDAVGEIVLSGGKPGPVKVWFHVDDFAGNHNGGHVAFGPDGKLWIGTGDGGGAGDPERTSQNDRSLLGKMLVLDVDTPGAKPEVRFKGLRNPWRYSFDRKTGDLWIGDVGQNKWEWVFFVNKARLDQKLNFGWSVVEGAHCFRPNSGCDAGGFERVVFEYPHGADGCSITGGFVYRGKKFPELDGSYVVGDYCSGRAWVVKDNQWAKAFDAQVAISSFGEDDDGELWLVDHARGAIHRVTAKARTPAPAPGVPPPPGTATPAAPLAVPGLVDEPKR